jgi:RimJ/RimL family protein N-acetyltransferase
VRPLCDPRRAHEPPELELIYSLSEAHWGQGFARHCAEMLVDYAFDALEWPFVQASADAPNEASFRVMQAVGMHPAGTRPGAFGTIDVYRITREEWLERLELRQGA